MSPFTREQILELLQPVAAKSPLALRQGTLCRYASHRRCACFHTRFSGRQKE